MKRLSSIAVALAVAAGAYGATVQAQTPSAPPQRPAGASDSTRPDAQQFINDMTIAGMAEVQLGKMASERASNADVKAFGQMMVKDHTQANQELSKIAATMNVRPPNALDQKHKDLADKLSKLQGDEFDREYMNAMVEGHQEVAAKLKAFGSTAMTANDPAGAAKPGAAAPGATGTSGSASNEQALKGWASKTLPTVQKHLERAKAIQSKTK